MKEFILKNGISIPDIGMGTWPLTGKELEILMDEAISIGYRMFDTADNYFNEEFIGNVIHHRKGLRHELFIMTKISDEKKKGFPWSSIGKYFYKTSPYMQTHSVKEVVNMLVNKSLANLKTDYIDCLIIHWPYADYLLEIWDAMVELYREGKLRSIGVSNCRERHLEALKQNFSIQPMVNQICVTPLDNKQSLVSYCKDNGIQIVCYAPLQHMNHPLFAASKLITRLSTKYEMSNGDLLLTWLKTQGIIPIPKSAHINRLQQNMETVHSAIKLSVEDMNDMLQLNRNLQYLPESMFCPGL